ncbi:MAG: glycosyltransferase family 4 protein [Chloroflexi bacterium]|nr:glycosyltransferase family 4 protein [Chloroflexota bacterium]MBI3339013.1 glycosyltransferase family 4 protein [Chloroflexota bacterium]
MRLLFIADGRSPIAQNWIRYFAERGDEIYLASTFNCSVDFPLKGLEITPVAFSGARKSNQHPGAASSRTLKLRSAIRHFLGPLTIPRASKRLRGFIERVQPDLVHAMRIPYEGMLAADAYTGAPLLVSVWGNDFTLHAPSTSLMRHYTTWTMQVADALHADCQRDIRLGKQWGFDSARPTLVTPGNGGIKTDIFYPPSKPVDEPVIINPRGFRTYVRNDVFFQIIPLVLKKYPTAKFICASMAGESQALKWIQQLNITHAVELLPPLPHAQMAEVFRRAQIIVSPSIHDGTPNSLLEGMACGCLPVAGDLESIREWITHGKNGLLADAADPQNLAEAILEGLENKNLRQKAAGLNATIINERAEYTRNMGKIKLFYESLIRLNR